MKNINIIGLCIVVLICYGCKEAFELDTIDFESVLVVESTLSDELKNQEIRLSRTSTLEGNEILVENNAEVWVENSQNQIYNFSQNDDGIYVSDTQFKVEQDVAYSLSVTTQDGREYVSSETYLAPKSTITDLYAEVIEQNNVNGIQVFVDGSDPSGEGEYFKYEYEETYKIVVPNHSQFDAKVINQVQTAGGQEYDIEITPREQEERVCYTSQSSTGIRQTTTNDLGMNQVSRFPLRFIEADNIRIIQRYSILVKQYTQSLEAYTFYKTIEDLSNVESILSENQPGYVAGNIRSLQSTDEKVLGYFELSPVTTRRIYFNYLDFDLPQPSYFYDCDIQIYDYEDNTAQDGDLNERNMLAQLLNTADYKLISQNGTEYRIVNPECGDCTSFSSNVKPEFWED